MLRALPGVLLTVQIRPNGDIDSLFDNLRVMLAVTISGNRQPDIALTAADGFLVAAIAAVI